MKINLLKNNNLIIVNELTSKGYTKYKIYKFIKDNDLEQISHGIYAPKNSIVDYAYLTTLKCKECIISHDEALYFYGLLNREPLKTTITTYTGYNTKNLILSNIKVYTVKKELLNVGKIYNVNYFNHLIPMYNLERTICDLIRSRNNFEIQDFNTALKAYLKRKDKDLNKLMKYAALFKIENVTRKYLSILL